MDTNHSAVQTRAEKALLESEERLRLATDASQVGLHDFNVISGTVEWDRRTRGFWGVEDDEPVTYETWRDSLHPDDRQAAEAAVRRSLDPTGDGKYVAEYRVKNRKDGVERWIEATGQATFSEGKPVRLIGTTQDITERKRAEEQLRRNHETFFNLIQNSPFGVFIVDSQFCLSQVSLGAEKVFENVRPLIGRDFEEIFQDIWQEPFASEAIARFRHTLESGEPYVSVETAEQRHYMAKVESYDWRIERIVLPDGQFGVVCYFYDLSDIKRAEVEIRYRSEQFEMLINKAPLGVYLVDADFRIAQVNPVALPVFEGLSGGVIGRDFDEVIHVIWEKEYANEVVRIFRHTLETGESFHMPERKEVRADRGVVEYYEWQVERITLPDGRYGVVCYFRDISDQVQARLEIAGSEERYRTLFNSIEEGFCIVQMLFDEAGKPVNWRYIETNPAFERQSGLRDVAGRTILELLPEGDHRRLALYGNIAITGKPARYEHHVVSMDRWFDVYAFRAGEPSERKVAILFNDITAQKRTLHQLTELNRTLEQRVERRARKIRDLASKLTMAEQGERRRISEILHDNVQQYLYGVRMKLASARRDLEAGRMDGILSIVREVDGWLYEAIHATRKLSIDLSPPVLKSEGLKEMIGWLKGNMDELYGLDLKIEADGPVEVRREDVRILLFQIVRELLFNIVKHAGVNEATLNIETMGDQVILIVTDGGNGFEVEKVTAPSDQSGVGLSSVRERLVLYGGNIRIESSPGKGTSVRIEAPLRN